MSLMKSKFTSQIDVYAILKLFLKLRNTLHEYLGFDTLAAYLSFTL